MCSEWKDDRLLAMSEKLECDIVLPIHPELQLSKPRYHSVSSPTILAADLTRRERIR